MTFGRPTTHAVLWGAVCGLFFFCKSASAADPNLFDYLTPATAYGAVLGLVGLAIQLWLRAAWPTGRLNEGRPNVMDPKTLVMAVFAAVAAGIAATIAFASEIGVAVTATAKLKYGLAIIAFGYIAADLGAGGLEKIWGGLQVIVAPIKAIWNRLTGSR